MLQSVKVRQSHVAECIVHTKRSDIHHVFQGPAWNTTLLAPQLDVSTHLEETSGPHNVQVVFSLEHYTCNIPLTCMGGFGEWQTYPGL